MRQFIRLIEAMQNGPLKLGQNKTTVDLKSNEVVEPKVIKLGSNPAKEKVTALMHELYALTHAHPFIRGQRLTSNAVIDANYFDGSLHISDIMAVEGRQGGGTEAMKLLCDLADKHDVKITLTAKAYTGNPEHMTTPQLKKWYERFGFKVDEGFWDDGDPIFAGDDQEGYHMTRWPK